MDPLAVVRAVAIIVVAYLIGGIPWGVIVARLTGGPDPRTIGSGRTGGANVMRALGPRLALLSGILDMLKGTVAVLLARALGAGVEVEVLAGLAAIVGHSRSPFLGLSGGRGVSAAFGAALVLAPIPALVILAVFLATLAVTRYSSVASLTGAAVGGLVFTVQILVVPLDYALLGFSIGAPVLIWLFHLDNIGRLMRGEERKFGAK
ncbi:MAG: glycerol-3-phosphate 1-O-acyltransferase PlsY [Chloroflexi bacterium]|jgi:glycerol-3-phosphate acyltransferase PlsY|nr:glycerol-3-phosphate 1-O-acyltransferase PlsY [Chloroflexota bacterium]